MQQAPSKAQEVDETPVQADYLSQNFPNPFNPVTSIRFGLHEPGHVRLTVYDVSGRLIRTLVDNPLEAKSYDITWDGRDDEAREAASRLASEAPGWWVAAAPLDDAEAPQ